VAPLNACPLPPRLQGKRPLGSCNSPLAEVHLSHQRARRAAEAEVAGLSNAASGLPRVTARHKKSPAGPDSDHIAPMAVAVVAEIQANMVPKALQP
jgi:hypothetical protein